MSRAWKRWYVRPNRFPKYQNLKYGERYWISTAWKGGEEYFRFRQGPVPGIHKPTAGRYCRMWRTQSMAEKRAWYDYEDQFRENGFTPRRRRSPKHLIDSYDDIPKNHYRGSWKHSTKKRRQWGGEVQLLYVG